MRLKTQIPILALVVPLAACSGNSAPSPASSDPAPITRAGFGFGADGQTSPLTPSMPAIVEQPVAVAKPTAPTVAVAPALPPPATYAEAMHRAQDASDQGDHAGAVDALLIAVKLAPKSAAPHVELARLYLADNKIPVARKHALKATKLNPTWSAAWNTLGRIEMADGKLDDARAAFQTAIESNEDNAFAWNNMGLSYIYAEQWPDAADALEHAVAVTNAPSYMWNNLGVAYEHLDRLDEARHAYEQAASAGSDAGKKSRARLEGVTSIIKTTAAASPTDDQPATALPPTETTAPVAPTAPTSTAPTTGGATQ